MATRPDRSTSADADTMGVLSSHAFDVYRTLVYGDERFVSFLAITPTNEIATLNVGSRPASRTASNAIEDLRAIRGCSGGRSAG